MFKKGDVVKCISVSDYVLCDDFELTLDEYYIVEDVYEKLGHFDELMISVKIKDNPVSYYAYRFENITRKEKIKRILENEL